MPEQPYKTDPLCGCCQPDHVIKAMEPHGDTGTVTCQRQCLTCGFSWTDEPTFAELFDEAEAAHGPLQTLTAVRPLEVFTEAAQLTADVTRREESLMRTA
jgi:hypothetical protein